MNKYFSFLILATSVSASVLEWQAEFRYRLQSDKTDSLFTGKTNSFNYTRSRISLKFINGPVSALTQIQDSRLLGDHKNSSGLLDIPLRQTPVFHQIYFKVNHLLKKNWSVKIGRFEMPLGSERLISKNNWNNYGRSFDGIQSIAKNGFGELSLFRVYSTQKNTENTYNLEGVYLSSGFQIFRNISIPAIDVYYFSFSNRYNKIDDYFGRTTFGVRLNFNVFSNIIEFESGMQEGRINQVLNELSNNFDANFTVLNLHINLNKLPVIQKLSLGKEYFSGDIPGSEGVLEGMANPFGAGHKYHGYFDRHTRFSNNNSSGLDEWNVKGEFSLPRNLMLKIHYHDFKDGVKSDLLGTELDIVFFKKLGFGGVLQQGFSRYWEADGGQFDYSWFMLTFNL